MAYCSLVVATDDEIAIQESKCFKDAEPDLKNHDECSIKKKYKTKTCKILITDKHARYKSVDACLKDKEVKPFFAGRLGKSPPFQDYEFLACAAFTR